MTVTSRRIPSTSCRYQSGKVSLSPFVNSTAYGSTDCRMLYAQSRAALSSVRSARAKLKRKGTSATARIGAALRCRALNPAGRSSGRPVRSGGTALLCRTGTDQLPHSATSPSPA